MSSFCFPVATLGGLAGPGAMEQTPHHEQCRTGGLWDKNTFQGEHSQAVLSL